MLAQIVAALANLLNIAGKIVLKTFFLVVVTALLLLTLVFGAVVALVQTVN